MQIRFGILMSESCFQDGNRMSAAEPFGSAGLSPSERCRGLMLHFFPGFIIVHDATRRGSREIRAAEFHGSAPGANVRNRNATQGTPACSSDVGGVAGAHCAAEALEPNSDWHSATSFRDFPADCPTNTDAWRGRGQTTVVPHGSARPPGCARERSCLRLRHQG